MSRFIGLFLVFCLVLTVVLGHKGEVYSQSVVESDLDEIDGSEEVEGVDVGEGVVDAGEGVVDSSEGVVDVGEGVVDAGEGVVDAGDGDLEGEKINGDSVDVDLGEEGEVEAVAEALLAEDVIVGLSLECGVRYCEKAENVEALLRATGLSVGRRVNKRMLANSIERLRKTGYFITIKQDVVRVSGGIEVKFKVEGYRFIRKLRFGELGSLFESELRKRMILGPGGALYPRASLIRGKDPDSMSPSELEEMALDDQAKSLQRLYTKEGYLDAEVKISIEEVDEESVDLFVDVRPGEGYRLGQIFIRGHHHKSYDELENTFRSAFGFFRYATQDEIELGVQELLSSYWKSGYLGTRIDFVSQKKDKGRIDVYLDIQEGNHWEIFVEGNVALSAEEIIEHVSLYESGYIDEAEIASSEEGIKELYISAGYYWVEVSHEVYKPVANLSGVLIFKVKEGDRAEIGEIEFDGIGEVSYGELSDVISSHTYQAFGSGAYPQRKMIADDAAKIVDFYRSKGYLSADVTGWTLAPISENNGRLRLSFRIFEGVRSLVKSQEFLMLSGEKLSALEQAPTAALLEENYDDFSLRAEEARILRLIRRHGYAAVQVESRCVGRDANGLIVSIGRCKIAEMPRGCFPSDPEDLCKVVDSGTGPVEFCRRYYSFVNNDESQGKCELSDGVLGSEVGVFHTVKLGPVYKVGDIFLHGNRVTSDWVIGRDMPFSRGDKFDFNDILEFRSLLRSRRIFSRASVNTIGVEEGGSDWDLFSVGSDEIEVPVVVEVEEGLRRWLDLALGVSLVSNEWLLSAEAEYVEANLFGWGWEFRTLVMPEFRFLNLSRDFVLTEKFNQNWFTLFSLDIPISPLLGLDLVLQVFYDLRYIPETIREDSGGVLELQWKIRQNLFSALALEAKNSYVSSLALDVSGTSSQYGVCYPVTFFQKCPLSDGNHFSIYSIVPRISYDGRDSALIPKKGFYGEARVKLAYSDFSGFYLKPELRASYVFTLLRYYSFAFNMRWGLSFLGEGKHLTLVERYFLGGVNVRGFENDALGMRLIDPSRKGIATNEAMGGETLFNFNAEFRFPIMLKTGIYGVAFFDMGSLLSHQASHYQFKGFFKEMFAKEMRYTAGMGLRWIIAENIPPVVLDYGFILNRRRGEGIGSFHLNIGYTF